MATQEYIFGRNPVQESLSAGRTIEKVFIAFGAHGIAITKAASHARKSGIPVTTLDKRKFRTLEDSIGIDEGRSQGIIALTSAVEYVDVHEMLANALSQKQFPIIVALDGVQDPHNVGAIVRTAECFGASGIILSTRNSAPVTPVAVKSAAGAFSHIQVAKVNSLGGTLDAAKKNGYWVMGADAAGTTKPETIRRDVPLIVVVGSEGYGIHHSVQKQCDFVVSIPMYGKIASLNASVAAGVLLHAVSVRFKEEAE